MAFLSDRLDDIEWFANWPPSALAIGFSRFLCLRTSIGQATIYQLPALKIFF